MLYEKRDEQLFFFIYSFSFFVLTKNLRFLKSYTVPKKQQSIYDFQTTQGNLKATIGTLAIASEQDELLKAVKLKDQLEQSGNAEGMYEKALLSLEF